MASLRQFGFSFIMLTFILNFLVWQFNKREKKILDEERRTGWMGKEPSDIWYLKYTPWLQIGSIIAAFTSAILIYLDP
jgi:hypothetical protein